MARVAPSHRPGKSPEKPFKYKGKVLIVILFAATAVIGGSILLDLRYEASSILAVRSSGEDPNPKGVEEPESSDSHGPKETAWPAMLMLKNTKLIAAVISDIGVDAIYPGLAEKPAKEDPITEAAVSRFGEDLSVSKMDELMTLEVSFQHRNPDIAADGVNRLVAFFKKEQDRPPDNSRVASLESQLTAIRQKLKASENDLNAFRKKQGAGSIEKRKSRLLNRRKRLGASLKSTEKRTAELQKKLLSLREQEGTVPENIPIYQGAEKDRDIISTRAKLLALKLREKEMLSTLKKDSPPVIKIRLEIDEMEKNLENRAKEIGSEVRTGINPAHISLMKEIASTENEIRIFSSRAESLKKQIGRLDADTRNLNSQNRKLQNLAREVSKQKAILKEHVKKVERSKKELEVEKQKMMTVEVISKAAVPLLPVIPNKRRTLLLAIFIGACSGLLSAFLFSHFEEIRVTPENVEQRLGLPVLTIISHKDSMGRKGNQSFPLTRLTRRESR